ncbi:Anti-sigma F factor [compost metagenome]
MELAKQPLYTSKPELERSGMGFTIMENFMDEFELVSEVGGGTSIRMKKRIESKKALYN